MCQQNLLTFPRDYKHSPVKDLNKEQEQAFIGI